MSRTGAQRDEGLTSAGLFASYQPRIRRYIGSVVHDPAEVDDLTQETFLHAHRKLGSLRGPDAVVSWLYRIATHVTYDRHRRASVQPKTEPVEVLDVVGVGPHGDIADQMRLDRVLEQCEMSACVRRYIEHLSTEYQQVIFLHDLEGLGIPRSPRCSAPRLMPSRSDSIAPDGTCGPRSATTASSRWTRKASSLVNQRLPSRRVVLPSRPEGRCIPRPRRLVLNDRGAPRPRWRARKG